MGENSLKSKFGDKLKNKFNLDENGAPKDKKPDNPLEALMCAFK